MLSSTNMNPHKPLLANCILYLNLISSLLHVCSLLSVKLQLVYDHWVQCVTMFMICKYNCVVMWLTTSYEVLVLLASLCWLVLAASSCSSVLSSTQPTHYTSTSTIQHFHRLGWCLCWSSHTTHHHHHTHYTSQWILTFNLQTSQSVNLQLLVLAASITSET